jgi:hypothetical protein
MRREKVSSTNAAQTSSRSRLHVGEVRRPSNGSVPGRRSRGRPGPVPARPPRRGAW